MKALSAKPAVRTGIRCSATQTATLAKPSVKDMKALNVTKSSLVSSQGGETTRNLDGVVYHITYDAAKDEVVVVDRKLGLRFPTAVDEQNRIRIDTSSPQPHAVAGFSPDALAPVLRGDAPGAEIINCRAAMIGYFGIVIAEFATGQSALAQLSSPAGAAGALALAVGVLAASVAPAIAGKVAPSRVIPDDNDPFPDRPLPYAWNALAEKVNGRVAMMGTLGLILFEQFARGGAALF
ncbi:hypothetical protein HYH03_001916 [Edaphochlamys debaryana]|uniref:Uncharacterized protein n=1 Tax=Edaphochlamys debaryana TaxID=47281 RepID=A0A835YCZ8_9CHLO|nr:hypothetical protein HYH03_001916 [Edaphochlamys debaryana]|eukprot:KAG2500341.1 hypothetical protein HYH03_001916 [Edaphochlamys debaryana]